MEDLQDSNRIKDETGLSILVPVEKTGRKKAAVSGGKLFVLVSLAALVLAALVGSAVFFAAVRGEEQLMVPDVIGKDIVSSLIELQEKELYPRIQLRYSENAARNIVLEQDPPPGTIVKAGRRVRLVLSQGAMINSVEDYRGRLVDEVRAEMQTLLASNMPSLAIQEPFMYEESSEPAGTILEQKPEPGSPVTASTVLEFVVSKGSGKVLLNAPDFTGLSIVDALARISETKVNFAFTVSLTSEGQKAETVVEQSPLPGIEMESDTRMQFTVSAPSSLPEGEVFSLFTYPVAKNAYPLRTQLDARLPSGETRTLLQTEFAGGEFSVPYRLPSGSVLILSMLGRELHRETVYAN